MTEPEEVAPARLVAAADTHRRRTEIWTTSSAFEWRRTDKLSDLGDLRSRVDLARSLSDVDGIAAPRLRGRTLIYEVPAPFPILFGADRSATQLGESVASVISTIHATDSRTKPIITPTIERTTAFLAGADPDLDSSMLRAVQIATDASGTGEESVLLHGDLGMASIVEQVGQVAVVVGDDIGYGRREQDLGWLLGDVVEQAFGGSPLTSTSAFALEFGASVFAFYARTTGYVFSMELLTGFATCRLVHHANDAFASGTDGSKFLALWSRVDEAVDKIVRVQR